MHELMDKVEKELDKIGDKGLTSSNLDTTYKLIDIYKDIKEAKYYEKMCESESESYDARRRDSRGRYMDNDSYYRENNSRTNSDSRYSHYQPWDDRTERYFLKIKDGIDDYSAGRTRYRDGAAQDRMIEGIEMAMSALVNFVETLYDHTETQREKDVIHEHIEKLKKI